MARPGNPFAMLAWASKPSWLFPKIFETQARLKPFLLSGALAIGYVNPIKE
jgi:hypothetical protein